ncbi:probable exported protein STY0357 [hydrothermal vent metagenome]|uniref:Probable exported protein STY0357 n=1 Tax=hydrothermal vent metagenome TaxID=652676 RepID=A0A3B0V6C6_9ZZZZ
MQHYRRFLKLVPVLLFMVTWQSSTAVVMAGEGPPATKKVAAIISRVSPRLQKELAKKRLSLGSPIFIRIFKLPGELEVWLKKDDRYRLFKSYPICSYSGYPGPKLHEGDWQSPEGFYSVTARQMNPQSSYHLAFNIGYPNEYDTSLARTGSDIMVHGDCSSRGCFAMNNYRIEEIYTLAYAALSHGQSEFDVHIFPFPLTAANMHKFHDSPWLDFWNNLREGYNAFAQTHLVPVITCSNGRYIVTENIKPARAPQLQ